MSSTSISPESTPPWLDLPREITATILHKLGAIEILTTAQAVCKTWRSVCQDPSMWRSIGMRNKGNIWELPYDLMKMCLHAVDRSQGQLIDIDIEYFATDDLLLYISERSKQLKRLQLVSCDLLTDEGLIEAIKNLPLLEELHLYYYISIGMEAIEAAGHSCPHLKSFRLNNSGYKFPLIECNLEALAVAKNMHGLRHLQLFGNKMTNEGVQAILDGCPHLESLDLRQCFNVHLGGDLEKLCSQRIKDLRRPYDPTDDYDFDSDLREYETSDEDCITGFSDIEMMSDYDSYLEFSGGSGSVSSSLDEYDDELFDDY